MTPLEVVKQAEGMTLRDEDGNVTALKLLPPLSEAEVRELEARIPCPLPEEARELFAYTRGIDGILESVDFSGLMSEFGMEEILPHAVPIAHDGFGNYWVVDLTSDSTTWGPIFFVCHDAPVLVFQTESLAHFISELLRFGNPPWESELDDLHEARIWHEQPGIAPEQCLTSGDTDLAAFARELDGTWLIVDLRQAKIGDGFTWGRFGPRTLLRRDGERRIFAYQQPPRKSLWQRVVGR